MNPEFERVWQKLAVHQSRFTNAKLDETRKELIVGDFAAKVSEKQMTTPAHLKASVGWSITVAQVYDVDETFREQITHHFGSLGNGRWQNLETEEETTDDQVVEWMLDELSEWIASNGRQPASEDESF
jgi:uncharacterized protein (DUF1015 family)